MYVPNKDETGFYDLGKDEKTVINRIKQHNSCGIFFTRGIN